MKRALPFLLLAVMLFGACSDDAGSEDIEEGNAVTDTGSNDDATDDAGADTLGGDASGDAEADGSPDATDATDDGDDGDDGDELQRVTTAVVVHADRDAAQSSYGLVQLRTGGALTAPEVSLGTSTDFGSGHLHVNATENGAYLIDSKSGIVRVLGRDETPGGMNYEHVGDIALHEPGDDDFTAQPQWVGESDDGQTLIISLFGSGHLAKVPVDWDAGTLGSPSLFSLGNYDDDGNPDPTIVLTDGDYALISLQRLTGQGVPAQAGQVLIWDVENETGVTAIDVAAPLFHAGMKWLPNGDLAAGLAGEATNDGEPTLDAGVQFLERVNAARYNPRGNFAISEQQLGGELWGFAFVDDENGYAVARTSQGFRLKGIDLNLDGAQPQVSHIDAVPAPNGWLEVTPQADQMWIADSTEGMLVLDTATGELLDHDELNFDDAPTSFAITESVEVAP